ncbi:MAG: tetratricopeptide repeat protein, partial [Chloroflexota bacterium]
RKDLTKTLNHLGSFLLGLGRDPEAEKMFRKALPIHEALAAEAPKNLEYQSDLGGVLHNLALPLRDRGELEEAQRLFKQAINCQRIAYKSNPQHPQYRRYLKKHLVTLANLLIRKKDHGEAANVAWEWAELFADDGRELFEAGYILGLCVPLAKTDSRLPPDQRPSVADGYTEQAEKLFQRVVQVGAEDAGALSELAWFRANSKAPFGNVAEAVTLAKKAVELAPKQAKGWQTLGAAQVRAGDGPAAVVALEKWTQLSSGGDAWGWFFLAMAHAQAGQKEQARKWYDQAVMWMEKNRPNDAALRRFRAEAAALLNLPEAPKKGDVPKNGDKTAQSQ